MAKLYKMAGICFEIALYLWIYASYIDYEGPLLIIFALTFLISLFLLALPSGYYIRGFQITFKRVELLGYLKVLQLFIFFILMPAIGKEKIIITVLILIIISIINWINQIKIHQQIKDHGSLEKVVKNMHHQSEKEIKSDRQVGMAWKTILPFFLWGLLEENNIIINLLICLVILLIEARLIYKLYINLINKVESTSFKKDFFLTLSRVTIAFTILIVMAIVNPTNLFNFVIIGFISSQFVNLTYRHTLTQNNRINHV